MTPPKGSPRDTARQIWHSRKVPEPEGDDGQIGARFQKVNGGGVPQSVRRDLPAVQGRAGLLGGSDGPVEAVAHPGAGHRRPVSVGEHWAFWCGDDPLEPGAQISGGAGPQRDDALLAALAVEVQGGLAFQEHVVDP